jgi:NAD-dependent SIR2 family protein deacetylase
MMSDSLAKARESVRRAHSIVALTGAGISAESGIPTFRDAMTGHVALSALEETCTARGSAFMLVTQNVDGLHHASGSRNVDAAPRRGVVRREAPRRFPRDGNTRRAAL